MAFDKTIVFTFEVPLDSEDPARREDQLVEIFHRLVRFNFPTNNFDFKVKKGWVHNETVEADKK